MRKKTETKEVPLSKIKFDKTQPRQIVHKDLVKSLAKSLKVEGLIHPIELDKDYKIIVGELRYRAAKSLGWKTMRATIYEEDLTPYQRLRRQLAENLQQSGSKRGGNPMNPIDTAKALAKLYELKTGKPISDYERGQMRNEKGRFMGSMKDDDFAIVVEEVGINFRTALSYVGLLNEPDYVIESLIRKNPVPRTYYVEANKISDDEWSRRFKKAIAEGKIENREDVKRFANVVKKYPELAEIELYRISRKQSEDVNKVLNKIIELRFALKDLDTDKLEGQDRGMLLSQLRSIYGSIRTNIGSIKSKKRLTNE